MTDNKGNPITELWAEQREFVLNTLCTRIMDLPEGDRLLYLEVVRDTTISSFRKVSKVSPDKCYPANYSSLHVRGTEKALENIETDLKEKGLEAFYADLMVRYAMMQPEEKVELERARSNLDNKKKEK